LRAEVMCPGNHWMGMAGCCNREVAIIPRARFNCLGIDL